MEPSTEAKLTVYFDEPFWVGVFEELDGKDLSVCRVVFGAEPTDAEIYAFILKYFNHLRFSPPVKTEIKHKADNPKRRQRNATQAAIPRAERSRKAATISTQATKT